MKCSKCGKPSYNELCPDCFLESRGRAKYESKIIGHCDKCGIVLFEPIAVYQVNDGHNFLCKECQNAWYKVYDKSNLGAVLRLFGSVKHSVEWKEIFKKWLESNPSRRDSK